MNCLDVWQFSAVGDLRGSKMAKQVREIPSDVLQDAQTAAEHGDWLSCSAEEKWVAV